MYILLIGIGLAAVVFGLLWLFFRVRAEQILQDVTQKYIGLVPWVDKDTKMNLLDISSLMFFAYIFGMASEKITPEDKEKLKPLVEEMKKINELLAAYFQHRNVASFCFWASTASFFVGMTTLMVFLSIKLG